MKLDLVDGARGRSMDGRTTCPALSAIRRELNQSTASIFNYTGGCAEYEKSPSCLADIWKGLITRLPSTVANCDGLCREMKLIPASMGFRGLQGPSGRHSQANEWGLSIMDICAHLITGKSSAIVSSMRIKKQFTL